MRCVKCGSEMKSEAMLNLEAEVRGEKIPVKVNASQCSGCGRVVLSARARKAYHRAASDGYRAKHNLLTISELNGLRCNLAMTWTEFSDRVGVGIATLKRWLAGEIQSPTYDEHVRLKADPEYARRKADELLLLLISRNSEAVTVTNEIAKPASYTNTVRPARSYRYANSDYAHAA